MASTTRGIVYPTSGDNIAPLETHFASLAQTADDAISDLQVIVEEVETSVDTLRTEVGVVPRSGTFSFTGPTSTTAPSDFTVTLPPGYFTSAPNVVATVSGINTSSAYFPVLYGITTGQFGVRVWRTTGTTAESLVLQWIAK
jgi:hypothetical protein